MDNNPLLTSLLCTDFAGITKGRQVPGKNVSQILKKGVGWVPANLLINAFDEVAEGPFSSNGDLRLIPDETTQFNIERGGDLLPLNAFLCDIRKIDGKDWDCCPRTFLKQAVLAAEDAGISIKATFEHEFTLLNVNHTAAPSFSFRSFASVSEFADNLVRAFNKSHLELENFLPEYGVNQYEVTVKPKTALVCADEAVIFREIVYEIARLSGYRASFCPKLEPESVANGVHIHLSLEDKTGTPITYDKNGEAGLSLIARQFIAGMGTFLDSLTGFTASSVVSYQRLQPHSWSASYTCVGYQNREATIRICPASVGTDSNKSTNFEYRAADATANPYLALGVLIRAGLEGIKKNLPLPPLVEGCPDDLSEEEKKNKNLRPLPTSLSQAIEMAFNNTAVASWFSDDFKAAYAGNKMSEVNRFKNVQDSEICAAYSKKY